MSFDALAIGAHPDDVELGCGGTLIGLVDRGYRVGLVDMTDGRLSTRGDPETRMKEAEDAARIIGAAERFQLGFQEGSLQSGQGNLEALVALLRRTRPQVVLAPYWEDRHPDHVDASRLVQSACFWAGVPRYGAGDAPHRPHRLVYYFGHWVGPVSLVVDVSATFERKMQAVRAYRSQFQPEPSGEAATFISRPEFLEGIISRARVYGSLTQVEYGEPFYVREMNRTDDLIAWARGQGA